MAAGYTAYRLAGGYRLPRAGGSAGMSQGMPERFVEDGPYRWTRNPMYGGHLLFLTGLALSSRSPLAAGLLGWHLRWPLCAPDPPDRVRIMVSPMEVCS